MQAKLFTSNAVLKHIIKLLLFHHVKPNDRLTFRGEKTKKLETFNKDYFPD